MKRLTVLLITIISLLTAIPAKAQAPESIWIAASVSSFKTGETVVVTVNASSATPVQGFTFQIKYDPACLKPVNAASSVSGMTGLSLPQISGLVDASFASTTPQVVNGVLAEVRFVTLGACQTNVSLESAALVIKNESGFAAPLPNIATGQKDIPLAVSAEKGTSQDVPLLGTPLPLGAEPASSSSLPIATVIVLVMIGIIILIGIFIVFRILRGDNSQKSNRRR